MAKKAAWTQERQRAFLVMLGETGSVIEAARSVGMMASGIYKVRQKNPEFAADWADAVRVHVDMVEAALFDHARMGNTIERIDKRGARTIRRTMSERAMMFVLKAHKPEVYGDAPRAVAQAAVTVNLIEGTTPAEQVRLEIERRIEAIARSGNAE